MIALLSSSIRPVATTIYCVFEKEIGKIILAVYDVTQGAVPHCLHTSENKRVGYCIAKGCDKSNTTIIKR